MGAVVAFDPVAFQANFPVFFAPAPNFVPLTQTVLVNTILPIATTYCPIDGSGPVCDATALTTLINLMVAHCAQLLYGSAIQPQPGLVGRIASAGQGSVSVAADFPSGNPNAAWFNQTQYGAMYWTLSAPWRLARYYPKVSPYRYGPGRRPWRPF